jgi:hypothetical protein
MFVYAWHLAGFVMAKLKHKDYLIKTTTNQKTFDEINREKKECEA